MGLTGLVKKVMDNCPTGTCPTSETCCDIGDGTFGCCPYAGADCCTDHAHCCPNGYMCDLAKGECIKSFGDHLLSHAPLKDIYLRTPQDCPTGTCPNTETCCILGESYGCCPYLNAACCSDQTHCCPNGYTCDLTKGECVNSFGSYKSVAKAVLVNIRTPFDDCPPETCPTTDTCCSLGDGSFGCCPYPNAVCCAELTHCCPNGFLCNSQTGLCVKEAAVNGVREVAWDAVKVNVVLAELKAVVDPCACPASNTCCPDGSGGMGCCPYVLAACCADHQNCCPNGYTCDFSTSQCVHQYKFSNAEMKALISP